MINSCKATKQINSFEYVAIPSPRDVFAKYGERISNRGEYSTDAQTICSPAMCNSSSVIDTLINAERMIQSELAKGGSV